MNAAFGDTFEINPKGIFLRTNVSDTPATPLILDLSTSLSFPVRPGDTLHLQRHGAYSAYLPVFPDSNTGLYGIFSSSNALLPQSDLHRVPGAINAGLDFVSPPNYYDELSTDISEDFIIDTMPSRYAAVDVVVPIGAHYLFIGTENSYAGYNSDPNRDFALTITPVPEPSTLLALGLGLACVPLLLRLTSSRGRTCAISATQSRANSRG
jgi:hypothetical protein